MSSEPLEIAAYEILVQASAAIEVTLDHPDLTPLKAILALAREEATAAIRGLISIEPTQVSEIRRLQFEARRYESLVQWLTKIVVDGKEASAHLRLIANERAEEFRALILDDPEDDHQNGAMD